MKARSAIHPGLCAVDNIDGMAHVSVFANVIEVNEEEEQGFEYDHYLIIVPNRDGLAEEIEANHSKWIEFGIANESQPKPETDQEKISRMESEKQELEGIVSDLVQVLVDKGVVF